jgi:hypothetical protein
MLNVTHKPFTFSMVMPNVVSLSYDECRFAECRLAECHFAECHYAESRGAVLAYSSIGSWLHTQI